MQTEYDVIIVGAGPAGLSAGIVFASHSLRTLVLEQKTLPADKACGEGIMPVGLAALEKLQVKQKLRPGEYQPFYGVRYLMDGLPEASADFSQGPGWGIRRTTLSEAFLRRAQELDCLEVQSGLRDKVRRFERSENGITVYVGERGFRARLLVGADGLDSRVMRWAGLEGRPGPVQRWGARQHYHAKPWSEYVEVYWKDSIEAYLTPCGERTVGVAVLWDRNRPLQVRGGEEFFPSLVAEFPAVMKRLEGAQPLGDIKAVGPMSRKVISPAAEGVLLVGDAAGYLDAITGEGISLALSQALAIQEKVVPVLKKKHKRMIQREDLDSYVKLYRRMYAPYRQMTGLALFLSRKPKLARFVIQLFNKYPEIFRHMLSVNMGQSSLWPGFRKAAGFLKKQEC